MRVAASDLKRESREAVEHAGTLGHALEHRQASAAWARRPEIKPQLPFTLAVPVSGTMHSPVPVGTLQQREGRTCACRARGSRGGSGGYCCDEIVRLVGAARARIDATTRPRVNDGIRK